jgi:hypothetical protein
MVLSELLATLRAEGLANAAAHRLHHAITAGHLPRPERDSSGRFRFTRRDLTAARKYLAAPPRPGRKKQAATTTITEGSTNGTARR